MKGIIFELLIQEVSHSFSEYPFPYIQPELLGEKKGLNYLLSNQALCAKFFVQKVYRFCLIFRISKCYVFLISGIIISPKILYQIQFRKKLERHLYYTLSNKQQGGRDASTIKSYTHTHTNHLFIICLNFQGYLTCPRHYIN